MGMSKSVETECKIISDVLKECTSDVSGVQTCGRQKRSGVSGGMKKLAW